MIPEELPPLCPPARLLLGPGPSMVAPRVYEALHQPIVGHLDPYFFEVVEDVRRLLGYAFSTANEFNIAISGTGTSGMETAVANFVEPGDKFAALANGYFCDRLADVARRHGAVVVRLEKPWGEVFDDQEARDFIRREKPRVVAYVQAETSTGAFQPGHAICEAGHEVDALVIADCVTSLGGMPVRVDETGIDIAYSCTQKGLSCPPGLAPLTVSPRALERLRRRTAPVDSFYMDLRLLESYFHDHKYHHTASATMFYALREALAIVREEGIENRWERHRQNHEAFVAGIESMGLHMYVAPGHRLWTFNTPCVPDGVNDAAVRQRLLNEYGIEIAGGFGPLAGKVFRIGLMGHSSTAENAARILDALQRTLK
ncbi:MAG TPA: alanine--glyoxylate aminotransferase family protein [Bryobacteraceae bacterium]|nr:alanine--glyoxylate aminotransferase family protein [Bryobacteraceae bacterium]